MRNQRTPEADADSMFYDRWSPRAFRKDPLLDDDLRSLFEAVRWAPSCYNEQPWLFVYAFKEKDREKIISMLVDKNRMWASYAPVFVLILTCKYFKDTRKNNSWAQFDAGAAWMSLALQVRKRGLYAHAMARFNRDKAYDILGISREKYDVIAVVAVGKIGDKGQLIKELQDMEKPNSRKSLKEISVQLTDFLDNKDII